MIDVRRLQARLVAKGYPLTVDGAIGPKTLAALFRAMGAGSDADAFGIGAALCFGDAGILANPLRLAHFMAQAAHESGGFRAMTEIWGPTPAQRGYEGRSDLGNTQPGDGFRYRGRGLFQITGRANYAAAGKDLGLPLVDQPETAAHPNIAVRTAVWYWSNRNLNTRADNDDVIGITRRINGGLNGLDDRRARLSVAKGLIL